MAIEPKVVWSEGIFITPQHLTVILNQDCGSFQFYEKGSIGGLQL